MSNGSQEIVFQSDMNPDDTLTIIKQEDGDFILSITSSGVSNFRRTASVEFCTPMTGGGKHEKLWRALSKLWMEEQGIESFGDEF